MIEEDLHIFVDDSFAKELMISQNTWKINETLRFRVELSCLDW